jgi:hypothetical protein
LLAGRGKNGNCAVYARPARQLILFNQKTRLIEMTASCAKKSTSRPNLFCRLYIMSTVSEEKVSQWGQIRMN